MAEQLDLPGARLDDLLRDSARNLDRYKKLRAVRSPTHWHVADLLHDRSVNLCCERCVAHVNVDCNDAVPGDDAKPKIRIRFQVSEQRDIQLLRCPIRDADNLAARV